MTTAGNRVAGGNVGDIDDRAQPRGDARPVSTALSPRSARSADETRAIHSRKATRQLKKLPQAERDKFFSELQKSGRADVYHYSAMLSHAADSEQAEELLDQMSEAGVQPNIVTYNTLINKHQETGQLDRASALLSSMAASGVRPDVVTYSSLIDGLSRSLRHRQAERLWGQMRKQGVQPDVTTYNIIVRMYCRTHRPREARATIRDMVARQLVPSAATYAPIIAVYGKEGDFAGLLDVLEEMRDRKVDLDVRALRSVMSALTSMGRLEAARALSAAAVAAQREGAGAGGRCGPPGGGPRGGGGGGGPGGGGGARLGKAQRDRDGGRGAPCE